MNIVFENGAHELLREMSWKFDSLNKCVIGLMRWDGDNTIHICKDGGRDFYFWEITKSGGRGMCGGIIFHRNWTTDESGKSVPSHEDDGEYSIHT